MMKYEILQLIENATSTQNFHYFTVYLVFLKKKREKNRNKIPNGTREKNTHFCVHSGKAEGIVWLGN